MDDFERVGGEEGLRAIVHDFIGRCFGDVMVGYIFRRAVRSEVEAREYEFIAAHLGAPVTYTGRPLRAAHEHHRILGGEFNRRRFLFERTLADHGVPDDLRESLIAWQDSLRPLITESAAGTGCLPPGQSSGN